MKKINSYIKFVESKGTNVIIKIYTQEEFGKILQNQYRKGLELDEDSDYISKIENRIRYFRGEDLYNIYKTGKSKSDYYIVLYDDNYIIGIVKLGSSPYVENRYWISFISVDEQYRSNGYSKILIEEIFKLAKEKNLTIEGSYQTDMGKERIGDYINKVADKYNVLYVPHEKDVVKEAIGYRSGNLVDKAECLYRMNSNRSTGHLGFGYYFFGNKEEAEKYDSREVTSVDFDDYNMFNVKSYQSGIDLHEALKEFNNGIIDYIIPHQTVKAIDVNKCVDELDESENNEYNYFDVRYTIKDILSIIKEADDISEIVESDFEIYLMDFEDKKLAQDCFNKIVESYKELYQSIYDATKLKMLNNLKKAFVENGYDISDSDFNIIWDKYLETISDKINKKTEEYKGLPTASTRIMKELGFEGVDVIGIKGLDNSAIGSVIYDIKNKK